ncbi:MAG: hypothetical protein Q9159_000348 [Coniocarpon cinnabarinum]
MAVLTNGNVHEPHISQGIPLQRFSTVPPQLEVPIYNGEPGEAVDLDLEELMDDPTELCTLLGNEQVDKSFWITTAMAYAKQSRLEEAVDILNQAIQALSSGKAQDRLQLHNCLCWVQLMRSRKAPRIKPVDSQVEDKDHFLRAAVSALNDASRIQPSFAPLQLARGVYSLLRAGVEQSPATKQQSLDQAQTSFDDCLRSSGGRNMTALMGKARVMFAKRRYEESHRLYQQVLTRAPELVEPDPRIGLGCCLWQISHLGDSGEDENLKEHAHLAWQRALEVNPSSKVATQLLGLYYLWKSSKMSTDDPEFAKMYKRSILEYTQKVFKTDNNFPLANATFGSYFFSQGTAQAMEKVEKTARKAIDLTDATPVASDGWYLLARKEHQSGDPTKALEFYQRADAARGGAEQDSANRNQGYVPAKFGIAQIRMMQGDYKGAERVLDRIDPQTTKSKQRNIETFAILGLLAAEEVFNPPPAPVEANDKSAFEERQRTLAKRALEYLGTAQRSWNNAKKSQKPDVSVLLNLARLYESYSVGEHGMLITHGNASKALECLLQVQEIEMNEYSDEDRPEDPDELASWRDALSEQLSPQLLNNVGCFQFRNEKFVEAQDMFQKASKACTKLEGEAGADADALLTTIMFNLGRSLEALRNFEQAREVYESVLQRHNDYLDARVRLAFITLILDPGEENRNKTLKFLHDENSSDMEVRALWGWYLRKSKRRNPKLNEDVEQRHFKRSLQNYNQPHDQYSLTAMGNIVLVHAREDLRQDSQKQQRKDEYDRAMLFFQKALQYDKGNAYAAQGLAIWLIEDQKNYSEALQVLTIVKDAIAKDFSVHLNLGHLYCELKQYSRAIESYELALQRKAHENAGFHASTEAKADLQILGCLGRAWLLKGKADKDLNAMQNALQQSRLALDAASPDQPLHLKFNIAFVETNLAQMIRAIAEKDRTLDDVTRTADDVEEAITILEDMRGMSNLPPPFDRSYIEQLANMAKNTLRRQMEREVQKQREYEEKNADRLARAREAREADMQRREEQRLAAEAQEEEKRRKVAEERKIMQERDRQIAAEREEEIRRQAEEDEPEYDSEGNVIEKKGKKKKSAKRKKNKSEDFINDDDDLGVNGDGVGRGEGSDATPAGSADERPRKKRKRRLEKRSSQKASKYKSADRIDDSDEDLPMEEKMDTGAEEELFGEEQPAAEEGDVPMGDDLGESGEPTPAARRPKRVVDEEDEEEEEEEEENGDDAAGPSAASDVNGALGDEEEGE